MIFLLNAVELDSQWLVNLMIGSCRFKCDFNYSVLGTPVNARLKIHETF